MPIRFENVYMLRFTAAEIDFMEYSPSAIAAAALLCAAEEVVPLRAVHYKRALSSSITDVDKVSHLQSGGFSSWA